MKQTLAQLRLARGWKQEDLAQELGIARTTLSRIESGRLGVDAILHERICEKLQVHPHQLDLRPARPHGGQTKPDRDRLKRHFTPARPADPPEYSSAYRLDELFRTRGDFMAPLVQHLDDWMPFLQAVASDSIYETMWQLRELDEARAGTTQVSTAQLGFDVWPVCDQHRRGAASPLRPALYTADWLCLFQVWVLVQDSLYRLDNLIKHQGRFVLLEIDGGRRNESYDTYRQRQVGLPTLRIPAAEIRTGPLLTERLS